MDKNLEINIIGAGLAGSEAAYQLSKRGYKINLIEMRPAKNTEAHSTEYFAELICSNSLKSRDVLKSSGLLKYELTSLNSFLLETAYKFEVPAGGALAIDRDLFSKYVTDTLSNNENINIVREECTEIDLSIPTIIASGPLTSEKLVEELKKISNNHLYFVDAISPIIDADSINFDKGYFMDRYGKGSDDYFNLPMSEEEYDKFYNAMLSAEYINFHEFEKLKYFEGCMPIEEMASRGRETLLFGPLKPVGLEDPRTSIRPFAVVQLRKENSIGSAYNIVGFQTKMLQKYQKEVLALIPGLENLEFLRYGSLHKNTYINSPKILNSNFQCIDNENIFIAGQLTGVEGYLESIMSGMISALQMDRFLTGKSFIDFTDYTAAGTLSNYVSGKLSTSFDRKGVFTPSNFHFGLLPLFEKKISDKKLKYQMFYDRVVEVYKGINL